MNKRDKCFCCDKYDFFRYSTLTVFASDLIQLTIQLYYFFQYSFDTQSYDFDDDFLDKYSNMDVLSHLETHFVMITLPLTLFLILKTLKGLRWIRDGYSRPTLSSYYLYSWSFYTSFFV